MAKRNYKPATEDLYSEAQRLITICQRDITSATQILENQRRIYERIYESTKKPALRVVWPEE
jgi:hypothetical protein